MSIRIRELAATAGEVDSAAGGLECTQIAIVIVEWARPRPGC